jgi:hypothetical protein
MFIKLNYFYLYVYRANPSNSYKTNSGPSCFSNAAVAPAFASVASNIPLKRGSDLYHYFALVSRKIAPNTRSLSRNSKFATRSSCKVEHLNLQDKK